MSTVLVMEKVKEQIPVYYISHVLAGAEMNYSLISKFPNTLVLASRKLRPYFDAHKVVVLTDQLLTNILQKLDASRRLLKCVVELSQNEFNFEARRATKTQAFANFLAKNADAPLAWP